MVEGGTVANYHPDTQDLAHGQPSLLWMPSEGAALPAIAEQKSCCANTPLCNGKPEAKEMGGGGGRAVSGEITDPIEQVHQRAQPRAACPVLPSQRFWGILSFGIPLGAKCLPGKLVSLLLGRQTL